MRYIVQRSLAEQKIVDLALERIISEFTRLFGLSRSEAAQLYDSLDLEGAEDLGVDEVERFIRAKVDEIKRARKQ